MTHSYHSAAALPRAIAALALMSAACSSDGPKPSSVPATVEHARPPSPPVDAGVPNLGALGSVRARFEADCPRTIPVDTKGVPRRYLAAIGRGCYVRVEGKRRDLVRWVDLGHWVDHRPYEDDLAVPISMVGVAYEWDAGKPRPPECDRTAQEVATYLADLVGLNAAQQGTLLRLMVAHAGQNIRMTMLDTQFCAQAASASNDFGTERRTCFSWVRDCILVTRGREPILDVDGSAPTITTNDGGMDDAR